MAVIDLNWFEYRTPVFSGCEVFYVLLSDGAWRTRVLFRAQIFGCGEEMLGEVMLRAIGCFAGAHMPGDGDGRSCENEEAEERDGKEDIHAPQEG